MFASLFLYGSPGCSDLLNVLIYNFCQLFHGGGLIMVRQVLPVGNVGHFIGFMKGPHVIRMIILDSLFIPVAAEMARFLCQSLLIGPIR